MAFEESHQLAHQAVVVVPADLPHARACALLDVVQQARPAEPLVGRELAVAAGADREGSQQQVERLTYRIGVPVRPEVPVAALAPTPYHHRPRPFVCQRHRQERVRLVVTQPDIEPRLMPLYEAVLEHQRFDLGGHLDPLDRGGRGHHLGGAMVQPSRVAEIAVQPRPQALGLAHVDDAAVRIQELVAPRCIRYRSPRRTQAHTCRLRSSA